MTRDWEHIALLLDIVLKTVGQAQFAKIHSDAVAELVEINNYVEEEDE